MSCLVSTGKIKKLAKTLNKSEKVIAEAVALWQEKNHKSPDEFPRSNDLALFMIQNQATAAEEKVGEAPENKKLIEQVDKNEESNPVVDNIYNNLGDKTASEGVEIASWNSTNTSVGLKERTAPYDSNGDVVTTRIKGGGVESFGTTFTSHKNIAESNPGMTLVQSTEEAVKRYIEAVLYSDDPHYKWIREQIKDGKLKGKKFLYYKELGEPSHATALAYLANHPEIFGGDVKASASHSYEGDIKADKDTIFVFGSNPEGRHGAGAAKTAKEKFGAEYGIGEGLTGNSYALPTKDLTVTKNRGKRSIPKETIIESIKKLYKTALEHPDKKFKIAYRNTDKASLNGYTGFEMIEMFREAGEIPSNIIFSSEWVNTGKILESDFQKSKSEFKPINAKIIKFNNGSIYYIQDKKVFDKDGKEVKDVKTINKVFANYAVGDGRAVVVQDVTGKYIINNKNLIMSMEGEILTNIEETQKQVLLELAKRQFEKNQQAKEDFLAHKTAAIWGAKADFSGISELRENYFTALDVKTRYDRSEFVRRAFSAILTNQLSKLPEDEKMTREEFLRVPGNIDKIFNNILNNINVLAKKYEGTAREKHFRLMSDFFIPICEEACNTLTVTEGIAISFEKGNSYLSKNTPETDENGNTIYTEEGDKNLDGETIKDGWMTSFRETSVSQSLTKEVRAFLSSIERKDKNGKQDLDDLGMPRYLDPMHVHAEFLHAFKDIINFDDIMPILRKMEKTKPWMTEVINKLEKDQDLQSSFYRCYRKDFQPYEIVLLSTDKDGKYTVKVKQVNMPEGYTYLLNGWEYNIEEGNVLTIEETGEPVNALYDTAGSIKITVEDGKIISKPAEEAKEIIQSIKTEIVERTKDDKDNKIGIVNSMLEEKEFFTKLHTIAAMAGIDISSEDLKDALTTYEDPNVTSQSLNVELFINSLLTLYKTVGKNYNDWSSKKVNEGKTYNIMSEFGSTYKEIAKLINQVNEDAIESSSREGDKTYYSHVNPNYMGKLIKQLKNVQGKSEEDFQKWVDQEFGQYSWFVKNGKHLNGWLEQIVKDKKKRDLLRHTTVLHQNKIEYQDMDSLEYTSLLINMFFSPAESDRACYHVPILSDAHSAEFIQFVREKDLDKVIEGLSNVVIQEFNRILLVNKRAELIEKGTLKSPIANYDIEYKRDNDGNIIYNKETNRPVIKKMGGSEFKFFPMLNTYTKNGKSFIDILTDMTNGKSTTGDEIKDFIKGALNEAVEKEFQTTLKKWKEVGLFATKKIKSKKGDTYVYENLKWDVARAEGTFEEKNAIAIEQLRNYFYNSMFATSQIIELTTTDLAFYKDMSDFQKRYKEVHAPSERLNTKTAKYAREKERTIYLKDSEIVSSIINDIREILQKRVDTGLMDSTTMDYILSQFSNVNVADAQAYRSASSYEAMMSMAGEWSDKQHESLMKLFDPNSKFTMDDFNQIWQTKKPYVYTQIFNNSHVEGETGIKTPVQHKNSEFLLLAATKMLGDSYKSAQKLKAINAFMEKANIDVVQFESTTKVGGQGAVDLSDIANDDFQGTIDRLSDATGIAIYETKRGENEIASILDGYATSKEMLEKMKAANNTVENADIVHTIPYEDYGIQNATPEHIIDHEQLIGTQIRKLIMADLPKGTTFNLNGREYTREELIKLYNEITTENILQSFIKVRKDFIKKDGTPNIEKISEELIRIVKYDKNYGMEYVRAFTLVDDPKTGKKVFNIPLYDPIISNKVQTLLNSMFKNQITKQKIKGGACIQASCYGLSDKLKMETARDKNGDLRIVSMEVYMPAYSKQFYEPFMKVNPDGSRELDISKMPDNLKEAIGYRVPTESKYSMVAIKIKGFLPQSNGSAIMLPAEITTLSGSDFDVDKLYIMLPEFVNKGRVVNKDKIKETLDSLEKDNEGIKEEIRKEFNIKDNVNTEDYFKVLLESGNMHRESPTKFKILTLLSRNSVKEDVFEKVKYDFDKSAKENGTAARNNLLIDIMRSVLTNSAIAPQILHPGNFDTLKKGARIIECLNSIKLKDLKTVKGFEKINSMGEAVTLLKNMSWKEIDNIVSKLREPINPLSPTTQVYFHHQNMTGGQMIGIYANHNANHALVQHTKLELNPAKFNIRLNGKKLYSLHKQNTGLNLISDNTAEFLAASVDNVKDPVLALLNQNTFTADMTGLLLRLGYNPIEIGLFMNQPAVKEVTDYYFKNNRKGVFSSEALSTIYSNYAIIAGISSDDMYKIKSDFSDAEMAENISKYSESKEDAMATPSFVRSQIAVLNQLKELLEAGDALAKEVKATRSDTQGGAAGPTIADTINKLSKVDDYISTYYKDKDTGKDLGPFIGEPIISTSPIRNLSTISEDALREYLNSCQLPYLEAFRQLGLGGSTQVMRDFFPQFNPKFSKVLETLKKLTRTGNLDVKTVNNIYNEYFVYLMSKLPFFGGDNIASSLERRKAFMESFPEYLDKAIASNPKIAELGFIKKLFTIKPNKKCSIKTIAFREIGKLSSTLKEQYMRDWEQLLYMDDVGESLALNLFKYCYYKNGFAFGPNTFIHLAPTAVKQAIPGYIETLRNLVYENWENADACFIHQYIRNHLNNNKFCVYFADDAITKFTDEKGKPLDEVIINRANRENTVNERKAIREDGTYMQYISKSINGNMYYYTLIEEDDEYGAIYTRINPLGIANNFIEYEYGVPDYDMQSAIDQKKNNRADSFMEDRVPMDREDDVKTQPQTYTPVVNNTTVSQNSITPSTTREMSKKEADDSWAAYQASIEQVESTSGHLGSYTASETVKQIKEMKEMLKNQKEEALSNMPSTQEMKEAVQNFRDGNENKFCL